MSETSTQCPKCDGTMHEGYVLELGGEGEKRTVSRWVSGAPVRAFMMGLRIGNKAQHDVRTYRCAGCGFLESYAK